jgi:5-methylcytosine-specific restriction endonuclease McrA
MRVATVTSKNLKTRKKQMITLACKIVHARDKWCQFCGRSDGKLDASHCIPRSRGWRYAVDLQNIILLCSTCHRIWHQEPQRGTELLTRKRPRIDDYTRVLHYETKPVRVAEAQAKADFLNKTADRYGVEK